MQPRPQNRPVRGRGWTTILLGVAMVMTACGGVAGSSTTGTLPDSEPGTSEEVVTLRMGVTGGTFDAQGPHFIEATAELSSGMLLIEHADEWDITGTDKDAEQQIIEAVARGDLDLGLVGTRALPAMGVTAFDALITPMLIDSYPLERAVIDSDIPAQMLPMLDTLGVTGLAVIGGGLRFPSGVDSPFLGPETYAGRVFHVFNSGVGSATVSAFGATATDVIPEQRDVGLANGSIQGFENSMSFLAGKPSAARHVTINAPLWPATGVLVASPETLAGLNEQQTDWLMAAVADTGDRSLELLDMDQDSVQSICDQGGAVYQVEATDLDALRQAVQPLYDELASDSTTAKYIDQILDLKQAIESQPLVIPDGCGDAAAGSDARLPDGVYRTNELTTDDIVAAMEARGIDPDTIDAAIATLDDIVYSIAYNFKSGTFVQVETTGGHEEVGSSGTYRIVDDNRVEFDEPCCGSSFLQFAFDGQNLTLQVDFPDEDIQAFCQDAPADCVGFIRVIEAGPFILISDEGT